MILTTYKKGFSLVEMIVYVVILSIISMVIINMMVSITQTYRTVVAIRIAEHSGIDSMERMTREIRGAVTVDEGASVLGTNPGTLSLVTTANSVSTTTRFYVDSGVLKVDINGVYFGPLTLANTAVTNLTFNLLDNGVTEAVKIDMTIEGTVGESVKSKTFHSTIILRGL